MALARAARERGSRVAVACRPGAVSDRIRAAGVEVLPLDWPRGGRGRHGGLAFLPRLRRTIRRWRPDVLHCVSFQTVILGLLATTGRRPAGLVAHVTGYPWRLSGPGIRSRILRRALRAWLSREAREKSVRFLFQTVEDRELLLGRRGREVGIVVPGSGVDTTRWRPSREPLEEVPTVVYAGRMIRAKGIGDLVRAIRLLRAEGVGARFLFAGRLDTRARDPVRAEDLRRYESEGLLEWCGHLDDLRPVLASCHLVVLPSWSEGVPKILLEAGAAGRAAVATDLPGCRVVIRPGVTGLLVPPRRPDRLAAAIHELLDDPETRRQMGRAARVRIERIFSDAVVLPEILRLHDDVTRAEGAR